MKPTFNNLYEIPESIRVLQGARLDFEKAIVLINRSYELGKDGNPDLGAAKNEFFDTHVIEGDIWVKPAK